MNRPNAPVTSHRLEEYATLEYILLGDLRDLLEEPIDDTNRKWLIAVLEALLDTMPREFALQEEGGYLSEVLEQYPNWYNHVDRLQEEQRALYAKLRQLREQIVGRPSLDGIAGEVRNDLRDWMNHFIAHHRHERRIVQAAFNLDVGSGE